MMKKYNSIFLLFILWCFLNITDGLPSRKIDGGYRYIPGTDGLYKYHDTLSELNGAIATCQAEGATLFYPADENELNAVIEFWQDIENNNFPDYFMLGMKTTISGFNTISGVPISKVYNKWLDGEHNYQNGYEDCVEIWNKSNSGWGLNDVPCSAWKKYICKRTYTNIDELPIDQRNNEYHLIPETDGSYKYHDTPLEWSSAVETCENEGAVLFHPADERELTTVASFYNSLGRFRNVLWLGVRKRDNRFKTVTGVLISNTFNIWNSQQINHDYEDCLEAVQTSAWELYARECTKNNVFLCKKPVINQNYQSVRTINNEVVPRHHISKPGYHVVPGTNGLYKYHNIRREWETALAICNEEGATLFYPADENELLAVIRFWQNAENGNVPERILLDLKKAEPGFRTMAGMPVSKMFNKWMYNEPNNMRGNENCVEVVNRGNNDWALNDITCWVTRKYICKATITEDDQLSLPNFGYKFSEVLGKSYKLHLTPKNWNEAQAVCQAEASNLAVINSPAEAAHLVSLMDRINNSMTERFTHGIILLGFYKQNVEDWQTVQGEMLSNIKYRHPWGKQPDSGNGEKCGAMYYTGHLTDINCDRKALFICEHVVDDIDVVSEPDIS